MLVKLPKEAVFETTEFSFSSDHLVVQLGCLKWLHSSLKSTIWTQIGIEPGISFSLLVFLMENDTINSELNLYFSYP